MASIDSEFAFELCVCRWAEREWPPSGGDRPVIVGRQLGVKRRRWDTVVVECDPDGLRARAAFGERPLDSDLLHVVRHAPDNWAWYQDALPDPGYPWRYVRAAVHRAADRGLVETRRRGNRVELRRKWAYPDWIERVVAIENKPNLSASAARALQSQIERDVALALADEVWVATRATRDPVEPALIEDVPVEAGILTVALESDSAGPTASVAWNPRSLSVHEPGTRILERPEDAAASAARFEYAGPEWKAAKRREIAERAYGGGWRSYAETMRTDCRHFQLRATSSGTLPWCSAKDCHQTASECTGSCGQFEPEPPVWRTNGWPIEGGPGNGIETLLARQRRRGRPELDEFES